MRHLRIIGLCAAAVMAVFAIAASSASAAGPEWGECVAKTNGKYADSNCTTAHKGGSYEWIKGSKLPPRPFTGHNLGSGGVLGTGIISCWNGGNRTVKQNRKSCAESGGEEEEVNTTVINVECESEQSTGEAVGKDKIANVHVTFKGCTLEGFFPCQNESAATGEVKTETLSGELGYINKAGHEVGVRLTPAKKHGPFATFLCGSPPSYPVNKLRVEVGGGNAKEGAAYLPENKGGNDAIISPITPVNAMTHEFTQVYTVNKATVENIPSKFEGKPISLLEDWNEQLNESPPAETQWSRADEEITNVNVPSTPGEIKG